MSGFVPDALRKNGDGSPGRRALIGEAGHQPFDAAEVRVEALRDDQTLGLHSLYLGAPPIEDRRKAKIC